MEAFIQFGTMATGALAVGSCQTTGDDKLSTTTLALAVEPG